MNTRQSKLKSPYTPEVGGANSRIAPLVKLSQRPSGCQDNVQRSASLSVGTAVEFKNGRLNKFMDSLWMQLVEQT